MLYILHERKKDKSTEINYPFYSSTVSCDFDSYSCPFHWHSHIEILYFTSGKARVYAGNHWINVSKGHLIIINAKEVHSVEAPGGAANKHTVIGFEPEFLQSAINSSLEMKYLLPFIIESITNDRVINIDKLKGNPVQLLIDEIQQEYKSKQYGFELAMKANICRLFLWILRYWHYNGVNIGDDYHIYSSNMLRLNKILDHLNTHFREDLSGKEIAKMCYLSYRNFSRIFKSVTNKTFSGYIINLKLNEAEKLMLTTDLSISGIAAKSGFNDTSYFIKQFKRVKGVPPQQYRYLVLNRETPK